MSELNSGEYTYYNKLKEDNIYIRDINKDILTYLKKDKRLTNLTSKLIASRYTNVDDVKKIYDNKLSDVMSMEYISGLPDIEIASDVIIKHLKSDNPTISVLSDSDCDGQVSAVLSKLMFKNIFDIDVEIMLSKKRTNGYGINDTVVKDVIENHKKKPYDLILISDHGITDGVNIKKITDTTGVDFIVTDHHLLDSDKNKYPNTALAVVNPQRESCTISRNLSGAHVLYYTLLYTAYKYYNGKIPNSKMNLIYYYLTYVGMTIISDFMRLNDYVNRKIVSKALGMINNDSIEHTAFWKVFKSKVKSNYYINETTLSFEIIPLINSTNRIDDPIKGYNLMVCDDYDYCLYLYDEVKKINDKRKELQNIGINSKHVVKYETDIIHMSISKDVKNVQGILASRMLSDFNYMLAIIFIESDDGKSLSGSGRMIDRGGENLRDILDNINNKSDIILEFGGHSGAAGLKIKNRPEEFFNLLKEEVNKTTMQRDDSYYVDDVVYSNRKLITSIYDVRNGGPYGSAYPKPSFVSDVEVDSYRVYDKKQNVYLNAMVKLSDRSGHTVSMFYSIPMNEKDDFLNRLKSTKKLRIVYSISINNYMDNNKISLDAIKVFLK